MLFRDMLDQTFDEVYYRNGFLNILVIFMPVVMKSDGLGIFVIMVDPGGGNDWSSEITPDIFCYNFGVTFVWFGIDVKTFFMIRVALGFYFFEGGTKFSFHFIKECSSESVAQVSVIKMMDRSPETIIAETTFRDQAMDMGIPF